jgi:ubiquitin-conjugating enzyme E2 D/E
MSETRIMKEIEELYRDPPDNVTAGPIDEKNIHHWIATIEGPDDTDYKNGVFILDIQIPKEYPFKPPECKFKTKIYHPNINKDNGNICLNILKPDKWNPSLSISNVLLSIMVLLAKPKFDDPLNREASNLFYKSEKEYKERVLQWVKDYSALENIK